MRSRYSAYALGSLGQYLIDTWHPSVRGQLNVQELSRISQKWLGLLILNTSQKGDSAIVEFIASYAGANESPIKHHEVSFFERINGQWYYLNGKISYSS
jgi:SEC-C motif-containing protein